MSANARQRRSKRRRVALGVGLAAVLAALLALGWWLAADPLTPAERSLAGTWEHRHWPTAGAPNGYVKVWHLGPDRACRIEVRDATDGRLLDALAGRWRVRDDALVCDWEPDRLARARRMLPAGWGRPADPKLDPYRIESADDDAVVLRPRGGPVPYDLRRVPGR